MYIGWKTLNRLKKKCRYFSRLYQLNAFIHNSEFTVRNVALCSAWQAPYAHIPGHFAKGSLYSQSHFTVFEISLRSLKKHRYCWSYLPRPIWLIWVRLILPVTHYSFFTLEHLDIISCILLSPKYILTITLKLIHSIYCVTLTHYYWLFTGYLSPFIFYLISLTHHTLPFIFLFYLFIYLFVLCRWSGLLKKKVTEYSFYGISRFRKNFSKI